MKKKLKGIIELLELIVFFIIIIVYICGGVFGYIHSRQNGISIVGSLYCGVFTVLIPLFAIGIIVYLNDL